MRRTLLLTLLAVLAAPSTAALAAKPKLSPTASAVSAAGAATIEAANPNRYALRGTLTVSVGGRAVARQAVRLPKRSVTELRLRLDAAALAALRTAGGRATIALRLRRAGRRIATTAKRTLTLRLPAATPQAPPAAGQAPATVPAAPAAPASNRWVGRMGAEGAYDDFELTLANGQIQFTKPPTVPVLCLENGGSYATALSYELFDVPGPWAVGADGSVAKEGIAVNQLVSSSARGITYKVTGTTADATRIAGTLGMSFFHSRLNFPDYSITFINCSGSQSFEAVPAP